MVSQDFIDAEKDQERRPAELYHLWQTGIVDKYFTSGDVAVVYDGDTYLPATIKRGSFRQTSTMEESKVTIDFIDVGEPMSDYIDQTIVDTVWIKIMKIHRDMSPFEANIRFVGRVKTASFEGLSLKVTASGLKGLFKKAVPQYRYQATCNHLLYTTPCGIVSTDYDFSGVVSAISSDGLYFESTDIETLMIAAGKSTDNWTRYGFAQYGNYKRMIAKQDGADFYLRYAIPGLEAGHTVTVFAGCDGTVEMCYEKFDNVLNFLGFTEVPWDNPVTTALA